MKIIADENIPYAEEAFGTLGEVEPISGRDATPETFGDCELLVCQRVIMGRFSAASCWTMVFEARVNPAPPPGVRPTPPSIMIRDAAHCKPIRTRGKRRTAPAAYLSAARGRGDSTPRSPASRRAFFFACSRTALACAATSASGQRLRSVARVVMSRYVLPPQ